MLTKITRKSSPHTAARFATILLAVNRRLALVRR